MRKIMLSILTLIILIVSMTISVFAWFVEQPKTSDIYQLSGNIIQANQVNLDRDFNFNIEMPELDNLIYLSDTELSSVNTNYRNLATTLKIKIENKQDTPVNLSLAATLADPLLAGQYSGINSALLYLVYLEGGQYPQINSSNSLTTRGYINYYNRAGIRVDAHQTVVVCVDLWAYYEGLGQARTFDDLYALKEVYYTLVYRVKIAIFAGASS